MDSGERRKPALIFFDIKKTYDKVNRERTLEKLKTSEYREE